MQIYFIRRRICLISTRVSTFKDGKKIKNNLSGSEKLILLINKKIFSLESVEFKCLRINEINEIQLIKYSKLMKRDVIVCLTAITFGVMNSGCKLSIAKENKTNLLFIFTDEQQAKTLAVYGNEKIKAPNLDRLAKQSFVFKNTYITQPVSSPSRSSLMTGLYPHQSEVTYNNIPLPSYTKCFPELINDPDYETAYMGKWHLGDELYAQHGFKTWISIDDQYNRFFSEGRDKDKRSDYHHWLLEKGYKPSHPKENFFSRSFVASLPIEHSKTKFLEEKICEYLDAHKNDLFVLYVNFFEPHMPFAGPFDNMYKSEDVELPENFYDPLDEDEPLRYRLYREYFIHQYGKTEEDIRQLIAKYWGLVSQVDISVGIILDKLEELGLADNTIVVYTSDHGDMMGAHHMVEKQVMFEEAVRVPFMLKVPFISTNNTIIQRRVSQIDIIPTLLDLMGKNIPNSLPGKSLTVLLKGKRMTEDYIYVEWNPYQNHWQGILKDTQLAGEEEIKRAVFSYTRTVISPDGWKLCLSNDDLSQLFNLNHDPFETTNLFTNTNYQNKINFLTTKIEEWQKVTKDTINLKKIYH
jgi:arylsulfatase A-like enzyme